MIDYVPGKQGWFDANQPREGESAEELWIGDVAGDDAPTCNLTERVGEVRDRIRRDGWEACVVVNDVGIVLGKLHKKALDGDPSAIAADAMDPGPKTFRPSVSLEQMLKWMRDRDVTTFGLVTTSEGRLVGIIRRADAEVTLAHDHEHEHAEHSAPA